LKRRIGLVVLAAVPLGLVIVPPPIETKFWAAIFDVGHAVAFALIAWASSATFDRSPGLVAAFKANRHAFVMLVALTLAAATEATQAFSSSHFASLGDVLRDLSGTALFFLAGVVVRPAAPSLVKSACLAALVLIAAIHIGPVAVLGREYAARNRTFPVILNFDGSAWERRTLSLGRASLHRRREDESVDPSVPPGYARLDLRDGRFAGFVVDEPYPDWSGHRQLRIELYVPDPEPIRLRVRIHDVRHNNDFEDRFNREFAVGKGRHVLTIPLADVRKGPARRELDLSRVNGIGFYALRLGSPRTIFVGPFALE
jgi:hypothetical protein